MQALDVRIRKSEFAAQALDERLLLAFHSVLSSTLFPEQAGRYRSALVQVGAHEPPHPAVLPQRMRDYTADLGTRMLHLGHAVDDLLLEFLAYAEGELLSIHPFPDLNGRISRLWLTEILHRLQLPPVDLVPADAEFRVRYLAALAAGDHRNWKPLMALWKERLSQPAGINEIPLPGCTPTPLASYLKALAVLRLVAEAGPEDGGDPQATGFWRNDVFILHTRLTKDELRSFFLERYRPTPLVAPWGARSGFYEGSPEKAAREALGKIVKSNDARLAAYRTAIQQIRELLKREGFDEKVSVETKLGLLNICRSKLPQEFVEWLDACYVLTSEKGKIGRKYPPLLGSGGNEGSGSYVSGFAQQVVKCIVQRRHDIALSAALFATVQPSAQSQQTPGHFSPRDIGGANSTTGLEGGTQTNPWDYILALEGTLLFASAATRRNEFSAPEISFPFTVAPCAGGSGSYVQNEERPKKKNSRHVMEMWLPLWGRACGLLELRVLFSEGKATIGARAAVNGLDFARSIAGLGVDRGIRSFQRFAFLMRNGQSFFATPFERYRVRRNPDADLINDLDHRDWLGFVQSYARDDKSPNAFRTAARQLDTALFALTQQASRHTLQTVLRHLGRIEAALSISPKSRESVRVPAPMPRLSSVWAIKAGGERANDSSEFRIAVALAGLQLTNEQGHVALHARRHLAKVTETMNAKADRNWEPTSSLAVWGAGPLARNLGALLHRRRLEAAKYSAEGETLASTTGATCEDVATFLAKETDDVRISELFAGLACVDLHELEEPQGGNGPVLPPAFALLKIFFTSERRLHALKLTWLPEDRAVRLPAEIPARLSSGAVQTAVRLAWQRLRTFNVRLPGREPPRVTGADGPRWLAALCIPLSFGETGRLIRSLNLEAIAQHATEST